MRKLMVLLGAICFMTAVTGCEQENKKAESQPVPEKVSMAKKSVPEGKIAVIETDKGVIKFSFYDKDAPGTVANFKKLANEKFYDGLNFHRYEPGFVIQGGCPNGNGTGGPGYNIKAEFNSRKHVAGTVAMARSAHPDSAGSQFYICLAPAPFLDNNYTVFGQVTEGMETVLKIRAGDKIKKIYLED